MDNETNCDYCNKTYSSKSNLTKHKKTCKRNPNRRIKPSKPPEICKGCFNEFKTEGKLIAHQYECVLFVRQQYEKQLEEQKEYYETQLKEKDNKIRELESSIYNTTRDLVIRHNNLDKRHQGLLQRRQYYQFNEGNCFYILQVSRDTDSVPIYKFGISKDVNSRFRTERTMVPDFKVKLLIFMDTRDDVLMVERMIKRHYHETGQLLQTNHELLNNVDIQEVTDRVIGFVKYFKHKIEQNVDKYNHDVDVI